MTGKRISDKFTTVLPVLAGVLCGPLRADVVTLRDDGARLSGTVRSISAAGAVELASNLSPEPLWLRNDAVLKVGFAQTPHAGPVPSALVELVNGDCIPVTIESMDERAMVVVSPDAGRLEIPRGLLRTVTLGVEQRKRIYQGPVEADGWKAGDSGAAFRVEDGALATDKSAMAAMKFDLPERFVLRFTLEWEPKSQPNFKVGFADPLLGMGAKADRYFMTFNAAGIKIQRQSSTGKTYNSLRILNRTPVQFPENKLKVELRVNRQTNRMVLVLNDVEEDVIPDPVGKAPSAGGVAFEAHPSGNSTLRISRIEVLEDGDTRAGNRGEKRGDGKSDSLISTEGDRWGGVLTGIRKTADGLVFSVKGDFQQNVQEIPESGVAVVFFKTPADPPEPESPPFVLRLRGEGSLSLSSCTLAENTVTANHPLLGRLEIGRAGVTGMEKPAKPKVSSK